MNFVITVFISVVLLYSADAQGLRCRTPDGVAGECVNIYNCSELLTLLTTQSRKPEVINFLRRSLCTYVGKNVTICCAVKDANPKRSGWYYPEDSIFASAIRKTVSNSADVLLRSPYCGQSNASDSRIVGGVPAQLGQFPWIVTLGYRNAFTNEPMWLCGGSLITCTHVLTAAHCVYDRPKLYLVRVGDLDLYADDDGAHPEDISIKKIKYHEAYNSITYSNDVAILTLVRKSENAGVWPICLPSTEPLRSSDFENDLSFVAGWGQLNFSGPTTSMLQVVQLPVVSNGDCRRSYARFKQQTIDDTVVCAGFTRGGRGSCQGDSGGSLMLSGANKTFYAIGIVSYAFRCAEAGYPTVHTRVTEFLDWIETNLN